MKVEKKDLTPHPEGWYLFLLGEPEQVTAEYAGETKTRFKWPCWSSTVQDDEGNDLLVNLFTGVAATTHPADKHRALVEDGFGIKYRDYEDTDQITNKFFAGKVEKNKETGRTNIVQFDTMERCRPKKEKPKVKADPFEEE